MNALHAKEFILLMHFVSKNGPVERLKFTQNILFEKSGPHENV